MKDDGPTIVRIVRDLKRRLRAEGAIVGPTVRGTIRRNWREPSDWFDVYLPDLESPQWKRFMKRFKGSDEELYAVAKREELLPRSSGVIFVTETLVVNTRETLGAEDGRFVDIVHALGLTFDGKL